MKRVLFFLSFFVSLLAHSKHEVTVFVHGTVGSLLQLPVKTMFLMERHKNALLDMQYKFRHHELFENDQLAPAREGLIELSSEILSSYGTQALLEADQKRAWHHLAKAYQVAQEQVDPDGVRTYALFGWSGKLDNEERRKEGHRLYQELVALRDRYVERYGVAPEIKLVAHSHGGNVCLWMHDAEEQERKNLEIATLTLLGTPIQTETAAGIASSLFRTIVSFYSEGDFIQTADRTAPSKKSYRCLSDVVPVQQPGLRRVDVKVHLNGKSTALDHIGFFVAGRGALLDKACEQFPLCVYVPLALSLIEACGASRVNLNCFFGSVVHMSVRGHLLGKPLCVSRDFDPLRLRAVHDVMQKEWRPFDRVRHPLFNPKSWQMLCEARA